MFRIKKLIIAILNKLGHWELRFFSRNGDRRSHCSRAAIIITEIQIGQGNVVYHSEWDNFDALLTGIHGRPSIHLAEGIMLRETTGENEMVEGSSRIYLQRTKERSLAIDAPVSLPPFHVGTKRGPHIVVQQIKQPEINIIFRENARRVWLITVISRLVGSKERQNMA